MTGSPLRRACAALALAFAALVPAASAVGHPGPVPGGLAPAPGASGVGDRLYPDLGNGGYDVLAYTVDLDYHGNDRPLDATTHVEARATQALSRFDLDFGHGEVRSVEVDGRPAAFRRDGEELVITPEAPVPRGRAIRVDVRHTSDPGGRGDALGWVPTRDGLVMANQASAAHNVFPCNDHPSDKALFTFRVSAPRTLTVVANGLPDGHTTYGDRGMWTYRTAHPMATELAQVAIGDFAVVRGEGPHGLPLRHVVGRADTKRLAPVLARTAGQIAWMEHRVGPFPLETYGVLSADASTGFALETQTLSLFSRSDLLAPAEAVDPVLVHELSHQWFGDSVTPASWSDLWLNEGHATWYQWSYAADRHGLDLTEIARTAYRYDRETRRTAGPPAAPKPPSTPGSKLGIFRGNVYAGGALALYALRQEIGATAFQDVEREWVRRHRDGTASTADFAALASHVAGRDLGPFLHAWLYGRTTPPMPGHKDWKPAAEPRNTAKSG